MGKVSISNSAKVFGRVRLGDNSHIAQGTIIRSEDDSVRIGNTSFVLENSVVIGTKERPVEIGEKTVFGHKSVVIGAEIGNLCEIGNASIFLPGSKVGDNCIFGEGTIILGDTIIPDNSVVIGRPGRIIRKLTEEDRAMVKRMRNNDISLTGYIENIIDGDKGEDKMGKLYEFNNKYPQVEKSAKLLDTSEITGDVVIGEGTVIGAGVKIIGDSHGPIRIGNNVQILENSVLHLLPDNQLIIKDNVSIGPNSMIHGTIIGENSVIEAGAILCDNSEIGKNSLVKAGSLVNQRRIFEDNAIIEGFPAKKIGENEKLQERPNWLIR